MTYNALEQVNYTRSCLGRTTVRHCGHTGCELNERLSVKQAAVAHQPPLHMNYCKNTHTHNICIFMRATYNSIRLIRNILAAALPAEGSWTQTGALFSVCCWRAERLMRLTWPSTLSQCSALGAPSLSSSPRSINAPLCARMCLRE